MAEPNGRESQPIAVPTDSQVRTTPQVQTESQAWLTGRIMAVRASLTTSADVHPECAASSAVSDD